MSELKAYIGPHPTDHTLTEYYLKSEADKVIEEKDKELRRHKYKRCLAMAWWCSAELGMLVSTWEFKIKHYKKWQKRWLKLAEKFKENV